MRNAAWRTKVTALQETRLQPWSAAGVSKPPNYLGEIHVNLQQSPECVPIKLKNVVVSDQIRISCFEIHAEGDSGAPLFPWLKPRIQGSVRKSWCTLNR